MSILITGCAGFIGSHLCEQLLKTTKYEVYGIDNLNDYYDVQQKEDNLNILHTYDRFNFKKDDLITTKEISNIKPEIVVNIAAMAGVRYSLENPTIYMRTNVEGHIHLMNECVKNNVKHYVYASSSSVYGTNEKIPFSNADEYCPFKLQLISFFKKLDPEDRMNVSETLFSSCSILLKEYLIFLLWTLSIL